MRFIYLGDIMGDLGIQVIEDNISKLKKEYRPDFIIAQAENIDNGKGISRTII